MSNPTSTLPPPAIFRPEMGKIVRPIAGKVLIKDTGSMRPMIVGDTMVDLETPPIENIKEGDNILYENPARGAITAHQVKRVKRAANGEIYFVCEGLGNHGVRDAINVDKSNYIGRWTLPNKQAVAAPQPQPHSWVFGP